MDVIRAVNLSQVHAQIGDTCIKHHISIFPLAAQRLIINEKNRKVVTALTLCLLFTLLSVEDPSQ